MRHLISFVLFISFYNFSVVMAESQSIVSDESQIVEIGGGLSVETVPPKFITEWEEDTRPPPQPEWVIIPATYETITKTITVQPAYNEIDITPPVYSSDGRMLTPARAILKEVPAVTRDIKHRVVKIPSRVVKRIIPDMYHPKTVRKLIEPTSYIVRDSSGAELNHYENAEALTHFLNTR